MKGCMHSCVGQWEAPGHTVLTWALIITCQRKEVALIQHCLPVGTPAGKPDSCDARLSASDYEALRIEQRLQLPPHLKASEAAHVLHVAKPRMSPVRENNPTLAPNAAHLRKAEQPPMKPGGGAYGFWTCPFYDWKMLLDMQATGCTCPCSMPKQASAIASRSLPNVPGGILAQSVSAAWEGSLKCMNAAGATKRSEVEMQPAAAELTRKSPVSVVFEPVQGEHNIHFSAARVKSNPYKGSSMCAKQESKRSHNIVDLRLLQMMPVSCLHHTPGHWAAEPSHRILWDLNTPPRHHPHEAGKFAVWAAAMFLRTRVRPAACGSAGLMEPGSPESTARRSGPATSPSRIRVSISSEGRRSISQAPLHALQYPRALSGPLRFR